MRIDSLAPVVEVDQPQIRTAGEASLNVGSELSLRGSSRLERVCGCVESFTLMIDSFC